jgi:TonB family protein
MRTQLLFLCVVILTSFALSQTDKTARVAYIYCAQNETQQPVYLESCMNLHVGNFPCGQKLDVVERTGLSLKVVTSDGITRFVNGAVVSEKPNEMVSVNVDVRPAPECKALPKDQGGYRQPHIAFQREPDYPEPFRVAHKQGSVTIGLVVGADGLPHDARVVSSSDKGFEKNALEAVQQWRFDPAMRDGQPVEAKILVIVGFHLLH